MNQRNGSDHELDNTPIDEEDEAALAAIAEGVRAAREGRVTPPTRSSKAGCSLEFRILYTDPALADLHDLMRWSWDRHPKTIRPAGMETAEFSMARSGFTITSTNSARRS
jgi:hypothetical protein